MYYMLAFVVLAQRYHSTVSVTSSLQFSKTFRMRCGPQRLSQGWTAMSELDCVVGCIEKFGNSCKCFMYNTLTNLCTPCKGISAYSTPPSKQEGDLFFSDTCDSYPDLRIYSDYLLSTVYAAYIDIYLNYTDAVSVCQCLNSNMYSAKTMDKYLLYSSITNFQNYDWLGLDDIKTEGKFVWAEDGTEIGAALKLLFFAPGQPDNGWGSNEDCAQIIPVGQINAGKLTDANCGNLARFVCEKPQC